MFKILIDITIRLKWRQITLDIWSLNPLVYLYIDLKKLI